MRIDPFGLHSPQNEFDKPLYVPEWLVKLFNIGAQELPVFGTANDITEFCEDPSLMTGIGFIPGVGLLKHLPSPKSTPLPKTPDVIAVDAKGNAIPLKEGEYITSSPDGTWKQVRDADGNPTGTRIDGGHNPNTHTDPRALEPHGHVPGVTNPDGTPWLPINQ
jgi:hypothetical protein